MAFYKEVEMLKYTTDGCRHVTDFVVEEYPLQVIINGKKAVTLLCSPVDLEYLVLGFLASEGFIDGVCDVNRMSIDTAKGKAEVEVIDNEKVTKRLQGGFTLTTGFGKGAAFGSIDRLQRPNPESVVARPPDYKTVVALMEVFNRRSEVFRMTGGVHSCSLALDGDIFIYHEDVGRHNAVDKVIGHGLKDNVDFAATIMVTSGRISSEMLIKAANRGIRTVISRSAPTATAVKAARDMGMTLIGFARGDRFNLYK
jgi:FdhD protein